MSPLSLNTAIPTALPRFNEGRMNHSSRSSANESGFGAAGRRATLAATTYSSNSMNITYTNKDGDSVSLSMESVSYQQQTLEVSAAPGEVSNDDWQKIVEAIKDEYAKLKENMVRDFLRGIGADVSDGGADSTGDSSTTMTIGGTGTVDGIKGLPEYWGSEQTAQRIVDFATSFFGKTESQGGDFFKLMVSAIEKGFGDALGELGDLPEGVKGLADATHQKVVEKLNAWAQAQGIDIDNVTEPSGEAVSA